MKLDIFSIPVFINNISDIDIVPEKIEKKLNWESDVKTSFDYKSSIKEKDLNKLLNVIYQSLHELIRKPFKIELLNIWKNEYVENDFQENHIHTSSDFSFIIYKKCIESNTVFFSPSKYLMGAFYDGKFLEEYFNTFFKPELKENQIIIFPSFLEHMVKKNSNSITIAGNLKISNYENN
jgi:hypothetical protein